MKINKKLLMAALASAVIVSAPQAKTFADKQSDSSQAVTEKTIDDQFIKSAESADESSSRSQVLAHPAQATAVTNLGNEIDNSGLQMSEEKPQVALMMAADQSDEPNYSTRTIPQMKKKSRTTVNLNVTRKQI